MSNKIKTQDLENFANCEFAKISNLTIYHIIFLNQNFEKTTTNPNGKEVISLVKNGKKDLLLTGTFLKINEAAINAAHKYLAK